MSERALHDGRPGEVFRAFLLTFFGGPIAHLDYFRTEFVERRRWDSAQSVVLLAVGGVLIAP